MDSLMSITFLLISHYCIHWEERNFFNKKLRKMENLFFIPIAFVAICVFYLFRALYQMFKGI